MILHRVGRMMRDQAGSTKVTATAVSAPKPKTVFPMMLAVEGQVYKWIMIKELTVQEGAQFLRPEKVRGNGVEGFGGLKDELKHPSEKPLTLVNVEDTQKIIRALMAKGRPFRFMTKAEVDSLPEKVRLQLKGDNVFFVETKRGSGKYLLRSLFDAIDDDYFPEDLRCGSVAIRLVEDK